MTGAIFPFIVVYADKFIAGLSKILYFVLMFLIPNRSDWIWLRYLFFDDTICDEFTSDVVQQACIDGDGDLVVIGLLTLVIMTFARVCFYISICGGLVRWRAKLNQEKAVDSQPNKVAEEKKIQ